jgi:MFS superfamily sulfate permease-like transporter
VAPSFDQVGSLLPGAFAIAIMVFLETLAVARSVRRTSEPPIDNNQELVASGLSSVVGAFFRAMPAAGGFSQTAINQRSGARIQLSEIVTVVLAVACALFLGGVLRDVRLWIVGLPPATLQLARQTPRWQELADASRLFPTALAAIRAFRSAPSADTVAKSD